MKVSLCLVACACAAVAFADADDASRAAAIRHRREVRAAFAATGTTKENVKAGLEDSDPLVRRYALLRLYEHDPERSVGYGQRFLDDPSPAVRQVAKSMSRRGGLFRDNEPLSLSELNDHETVRLLTVRPKGNAFTFPKQVPEHAAVELWFGRPQKDLYVTLNGIYLGQFDADNRAGQEFRLDATKEIRLDGENTVEVKDGRGASADVKFTAEVLKW